MDLLERNRTPVALSVAVFFLGVFGSLAAQPGAGSEELRTVQQPASFFIIHNTQVIVSMWAGTVTFGLTAIGGLSFNGAVVGWTVFKTDLPLLTVLAAIVPHGVIEFPAFWLAGAAGLKIPVELARYLTKRRTTILAPQDVRDAISLAVVSQLLIVLAGILESTVTYRIVTFMTGQ